MVDDKPSITYLQQAVECVREGCWTNAEKVIVAAAPLLLEIAAAALAVEAARTNLYADPGPSIDKMRQLNLIDTHEAALVKFRDALDKVRV